MNMRPPSPTTLTLSYTDRQARHLIFWLIAVECGFALAFVVIHIVSPGSCWCPLRPLSNLDGENSLATWFSVVQLFCVGAVLIFAALNNQRTHELSSVALIIAGLLFVGLWIDEEAELHENLDYMARHFGLHEWAFVGRWSAWMVAYAVLGLLALALGARHLVALWRNFRPVAVIGLAGSILYMIGAVGFEIVSFPFRGSAATEALQLQAQAIEEFLEMLGVSVILYAALALASRLSTRREPEAAARPYVNRTGQRARGSPRASPA